MLCESDFVEMFDNRQIVSRVRVSLDSSIEIKVGEMSRHKTTIRDQCDC